jgi:hypothetical protein
LIAPTGSCATFVIASARGRIKAEQSGGKLAECCVANKASRQSARCRALKPAKIRFG